MKNFIIHLYTLLAKIKYSFNSKIRIKGKVFWSSIKLQSQNSFVIDKKGNLFRSSLFVSGINNRIIFSGKLNHTTLQIVGNNNTLLIEEGAHIDSRSHLIIRGNHCSIEIKKNTSIGNAYVVTMGNSTKIQIGECCMLSNNINIWASDTHPIFQDSYLINPSNDIIINSHVWLGKNSTILKGVNIGKGSVIGIGSTVTKNVPKNCIVAGNPARIIRTNINWKKSFIEE